MQTLKKLALATAATLAVLLALPVSAAEVETMKMGIEGTNPPFNSKDASGQVVGFDVEIGNALCAKMKVTCEVVTADWDDMIPSLNLQKFDFIISSMSITGERQQYVDFTTPYYSNKLQLLAPKSAELGKDNAAIKESLKGKNIGAMRDTMSGSWLESNWGGDVTVKLYDSQESAFNDLTNGQIDALVGDKYTSYEWLKTAPGQNFEFKGEPVLDNDKIGIAVRKRATPVEIRPEGQAESQNVAQNVSPPEGQAVGQNVAQTEGQAVDQNAPQTEGQAVNQNVVQAQVQTPDPHPDMLDRLNKALQAIIADGTYKKINDKYFPFSIL